jgi:cell pole-organizing protein PopZ
MGDVSNEPSMEDILSSIKRIIAEEGESVSTGRPRRAARPSPPPVVEPSQDEVLELSEPVPAEPEPAELPTESVIPEKQVPVTPVAEPILSSVTAEATRGPLEQLSRMIVKPEVAGSDTLEGLVRDLIRPMLREWLDANLPRMVEEMVQREITRITNRS